MLGQTRKKVPPEGGYGYVVMFANSLSMFFLIPVSQSIGLLLRPIFEELGLSPKNIGSIINLNAGAGFVFAFFQGPLVKLFGYRKYGLMGGALYFIGFLSVSFSTSVVQFLLCYGLACSIGYSMAQNAFYFAINFYFKARKTFAIAISFTVAGIGSVLMPQVMSLMISAYGASQTAFILSALSLHVIPAAMLLQPVKWHMKYEDESTLENGNDPLVISNSDSNQRTPNSREAFNGKEAELLEETELTSLKTDGPSKDKMGEEENTHSCCYNLGKLIVKWFDLDLLKDPIFISILLGLIFALSGEITFSMMYPLILGDKGFDIKDTAYLLSTTAMVDIGVRSVVPVVEKFLKWTPRDMYLLTLVFLMVSRFSLTLVSTFWHTATIGVFLGVAKGFRSVYMFVVLADYVPPEKLPSAQGIQTFGNGVMLLIIGPILGVLLDWYGNYEVIIHLTVLMSFVAFTVWAVERLVIFLKSKTTTRTNVTESCNIRSRK